MSDENELDALTPDRVFDGGDLDCGSGLVLLIRENMLAVPAGGVLEMRSREATVATDLPPWCRMVGHAYLGRLEGPGYARYFLRRGEGPAAAAEVAALEGDKARARGYEWRLRARAAGPLHTKVATISVGQPASFEERNDHPSAVEYLLTALAGDLSAGFSTACAKQGLEVDDIELAVRGRLNNVLSHLGIEEGDPSFAAIEIKCFASTFDDTEAVRAVWKETLLRSPLATTLGKAIPIEYRLSIV